MYKSLMYRMISLIRKVLIIIVLTVPFKISAQDYIFGKDYDTEFFENLKYFRTIINNNAKSIDTTVVLDDSAFVFNFSYKNSKITYSVFEHNIENFYFLYDESSNFGYFNFAGDIHTFYTDKDLNIIRQTAVSEDETFKIIINYNLHGDGIKDYFFMEFPSDDLINQINIEKEINSLKGFLLEYLILK